MTARNLVLLSLALVAAACGGTEEAPAPKSPAAAHEAAPAEAFTCAGPDLVFDAEALACYQRPAAVVGPGGAGHVAIQSAAGFVWVPYSGCRAPKPYLHCNVFGQCLCSAVP